jgi:hypothetical protein
MVSIMLRRLYARGKSFLDPLNRRPGGLQVRCERFGVKIYLLPLPGTAHQFLGHPACSISTILIRYPSSQWWEKTLINTAHPSRTLSFKKFWNLIQWKMCIFRLCSRRSYYTNLSCTDHLKYHYWTRSCACNYRYNVQWLNDLQWPLEISTGKFGNMQPWIW